MPHPALADGNDPADQSADQFADQSADQSAVRLADRHGRPLIEVATLRVPAVGAYAEQAGFPHAAVYGPDNQEIPLYAVALRLMADKSKATRRAYAKALLRLARFLWAIGSDPAVMTTREYRAYRRWLAHCFYLPRTQTRGRHRPSAPVADISAPIAESTVEQAEAAARTAYRLLEEEEYIECSPVPAASGSRALMGTNPLERPRRGLTSPLAGDVTRLVPPKPREVTPLPPELRQRLLDDPCPRGAALWRLMLESGPRIGETASLTPERMFLADSHIEVLGKGLGGATRWVPVTDRTVAALLAYQAHLASLGVDLEDDLPIWRSLRHPHQPIDVPAIRKALRTRLGEDAGRKYAPHALRHTAATSMLNDLGLPIDDVKRVLGHKSLSSTQIYAHADLTRATREFTEFWRRERARPALDISDLYDSDLLADLREVLDD